MDGEQFDRLARFLGEPGSRRKFARVLAALGLAAAGTPEVASAKKHKGKHPNTVVSERKHKGSRGKKKCKGGATKCGKQCVDIQTDAGNCGACGNACGGGKSCQGGQCVTPACEPNELLCGGACVPSVGEHPCCSQADCGGPLNGSANEIICDLTQHQCRCADTNLGICLRTPDGRGLCDECCAGGQGTLNCQGELGCNGENFCTCPAGKSKCPGGSNRCYQSQFNADGTVDDPTVCLDAGGINCVDCTQGGTKPYVCCWLRTCVDASGLNPGTGGELGTFCGGCARCDNDKMCCRVGPGGSPVCVPPDGAFCPNPST